MSVGESLLELNLMCVFYARKVELAFKSLAKRVASGETEEEAANHTGIELTQAAEVGLLSSQVYLLLISLSFLNSCTVVPLFSTPSTRRLPEQSPRSVLRL